MQRYIMHIDMDAFFASVEQHDNPELKGKPVIVGGSHRGVVSAASYEARVFGVRSALPIATARRLCPHGVFLPVRGKRYSEVSRAVMAVIEQFSPVVEKASIDEAYADITGTETLFGPPAALATSLKAAVLAETGLTCSVGIAPVKFLAKIASDFRKPGGLTIIEPSEVAGFLARLPVAKIPGVGKRTHEFLDSLGIRTAGDILKFPEPWWRERLGERGIWLVHRARGLDSSPVTTFSEAKSVSAEHTLDDDTTNIEELTHWLLHQAERVGRELREEGYAGRTITLKLKFADFTQITRSHTLPAPTDATKTIYTEATRLLRAQPLAKQVRLIGIGVSNFNATATQLSLIPSPDSDKQRKLDRAVDALKARHGDASVTRGDLIDFKKRR